MSQRCGGFVLYPEREREKDPEGKFGVRSFFLLIPFFLRLRVKPFVNRPDHIVNESETTGLNWTTDENAIPGKIDTSTLDGKYRDNAGQEIQLGPQQLKAAKAICDVLQKDIPAGAKERRQHIFLLGGAGTGKSKVIEYVAKTLPVLMMAPTGIAASVIGAKTVHSTLDIRVGHDKDLTADEVKTMQAGGLYTKINGVVLDEISFVSREILRSIDKRLRQLMGEEHLRFGGLPVIFVGDFYQLPPPGGSRLYMPDSATIKGADQRTVDTNIFDESYAFELFAQQRASGDLRHTQLVEKMRINPAEAWKEFLEAVQFLTADDVTSQGFADAMVIVPANEERHIINMQMALATASKTGNKLLLWDSGYCEKSNMTIEEVIVSQPWRLNAFQAGARCIVNENMGTSKVANGAPAILRSIIVDGEAPTVLRTTMFPNVEHIRAPKFVICELVNALNQPNGVQVPMTERNWASKDDKKNAGTMTYDLASAATYHKVQGQTLERVILDVSTRPMLLGRLDFHSAYVAITRVKSLDAIRVVPRIDRTDAAWKKWRRPEFPLMRHAIWLSESTYSFGESKIAMREPLKKKARLEKH